MAMKRNNLTLPMRLNDFLELIMIKINYCCGMPLIHGEMNKAHSYCQAN